MTATLMVIGAVTWLLLVVGLVLSMLGVLPRTPRSAGGPPRWMLLPFLLIQTGATLGQIGEMAGWPHQLRGVLVLALELAGVVLLGMLLRHVHKHGKPRTRPGSLSGDPGWPGAYNSTKAATEMPGERGGTDPPLPESP